MTHRCIKEVKTLSMQCAKTGSYIRGKETKILLLDIYIYIYMVINEKLIDQPSIIPQEGGKGKNNLKRK